MNTIKKLKNIIFLVFLIMACVVNAILFLLESIWATLFIFILSLALFHAVLYKYSKHEKIWKCTDYLFEAVAILSIIAAVSGLNEAAQQRRLQEEFSNRKLAQVKFIYAVETTITNDCEPLESRDGVWVVTPEPFEGECDRIKHILPQMQFDFDLETGPENMSSDDNWGFNLQYKNYKLNGSWQNIQDKAREFMEVSIHNEAVIIERDANTRNLISLSKIETIFYWHHILAFLLALKISRITMEVFKK